MRAGAGDGGSDESSSSASDDEPSLGEQRKQRRMLEQRVPNGRHSTGVMAPLQDLRRHQMHSVRQLRSPGALLPGKVHGRVFLGGLAGPNCPLVRECQAFKHLNAQLSQYLRDHVVQSDDFNSLPARHPQDDKYYVSDLTAFLGGHVMSQAKQPGWSQAQVPGLPTVTLYRSMRIQNTRMLGQTFYIRAHPFPSAPFRGKSCRQVRHPP